ncbi:MAG: zinc-binding dehydrogenase [Polyangia bacterium]
MTLPSKNLALRSLITSSGELRLSFDDIGMPTCKPHEVLVRVDAAPINPSDIGLLFGPADMKAAQATGQGEARVVTARVAGSMLPSLHARLDRPQVAGNEGAGLVVAAGSSEAARALVGKIVSAVPGGMYAQYRAVAADQCLVLDEGTTAIEGSGAMVNPLTVLGMIETMRIEGHTALVHTAAAGALGQQLVRACNEENIPLVNIVRSEAQVELLRHLGAEHALDATSDTFQRDLEAAISATGATLAFDAIGGGKLAGQILGAMESVLVAKMERYNRYGSETHKQVYLYGALDTSPTELRRNFGMAWGVGGWLLFPFLQKAGPERLAELKAKIARGLKTTFATTYNHEVALTDVLAADTLAGFSKRATGAKYVVIPSR